MYTSDQMQIDIGRGSWIRRMFEEGIELKKIHGNDKVFDFTLGSPCVDPPPQFQKALMEVAADMTPGMHTYMQNPGYPATRTAVAARLAAETGLPFTMDNLIMTVGAAGASNVFLRSVLNPGDEVIVIAPFFPEYTFYIANQRGTQVISRATEDCLPDLDDLASRLTDRTRVLMLNSPCNPTGRMIPAEILKEIGLLLKAHSEKIGRPVFMLSDEPYRNLLFDGLKYASPSDYYDDTIIVTSFSKSISLAGERIGYMAISPRCKGAAKVFEACAFNTRTLGFVNAPALMQRVMARIETWESNVPVYQAKRDLMYNGLSEIGYTIPKPEGTFFMFPRSPIADDPKFVMMLKDELVLVTPGSGFSAPGFFRISFACPDEVIKGSMPGFKRAFDRAMSL
jgi:aspartate aminotransferase